MNSANSDYQAIRYPDLKFIFIFFLLILVQSVRGQTELNGKVVDMKSGLPLPFATVTIKNRSIGTVTNDAGEFQFFVAEKFINDTLVISYLGYRSLHLIVGSIRSHTEFQLDELPVVLKEVTVDSDGARKLVQQALASIPKVNSSTPCLMEGFHRSWEKIEFLDGTNCPGTLIEAAVTIFDPGYNSKKTAQRAEEIFLNEIRRSALMQGWNYGNGSALRDLLNKNLTKYPKENSFVFIPSFFVNANNMQFEWEGDIMMDNEELSVIRIDVPNTRGFPAYYKVFISQADNAILRFELHGEKSNIDFDLGPWHTDYFHSIYSFRRIQGVPYLNYARKEYMVRNLDVVTRKVIRKETYYRDLLINNVLTDDVNSRVKQLDSLRSKEVSLALQSRGTNEEFWQRYNVIKENPLDKEVAEYFAKTSPCEQKERRDRK
jgi:hypothetical protein